MVAPISYAEPQFHLASYNVTGVLPRGWQDELLDRARIGEVVDAGAIQIDHDVPDRRPLRYRVTRGSAIEPEIPWLWNLYCRDFLRLAGAFAGEPVETARDVDSSIDLNLLSGERDTYEWHVDSNPVTGLLFATSQAPGTGGELTFRSEELGVVAQVHPKAGHLLIFDARLMPHAVQPLVGGGERLSVPMNYYRRSLDQTRPSDLDAHIYG